MSEEILKLNVLTFYRVLTDILAHVEKTPYDLKYKVFSNPDREVARIYFFINDGEDDIFQSKYEIDGKVTKDNARMYLQNVTIDYLELWGLISDFCLEYPYITKLFSLLNEYEQNGISELDLLMWKNISNQVISYARKLKQLSQNYTVEKAKVNILH